MRTALAAILALAATLAGTLHAQPDSAVLRAARADAWDQAEHALAAYQFESTGVLQEFDRRTPQDAPWRDEARAALDDTCKLIAQLPDGPDAAALVARIDAIAAAGCDDPLLVFFDLFFKSQRDRSREAHTLFIDAVNELSRAKYPVIREVGAFDALAKWSIELYLDTHAQQVYDAAASRYARALSPPWGRTFSTQTKAHVFSRVREAIQIRMRPDAVRKVLTELDGRPRTDPWLDAIVRACCEKELAWEARGNATWRQLSDEQRAGYRAHTDRAIELALRAHELEPGLPDAALILTQIAVEGHTPGGRSDREWFETAVAARFDLKQAYTAYMRGLQTRWGGSVAATRDFALELAATERYDTEIPWETFNAIAQMGCDLRDFDAAWNDPALVSHIDRVLDGYLAEPRSPIHPDRVHAMRAAAAWRQGRFDVAFAALHRDHTIDLLRTGETWYARVMPDDIVMDALALGGPHAERVRRAMTADSEAEAAQAFDEIIAECDPDDERMLDALHDLRARTRLRLALTSHEWVEVPFDWLLSGWRNLGGYWWSAEPEDGRPRYELQPQAFTQLDRAEMNLRHADPIGTRVELEILIDRASLGDHRNSRFGFMLDYGAEKYDDVWRSVLVRPNRGIVSIISGSGPAAEASIPESGEEIRLRVSKWDEHVAVFVDDAIVYKGEMPGSAWQGFGSFIGLSAWAPPDHRIVFSGLRIRIPEQPDRALAGVVPGFNPPPSERPRF